MTPIASVVKDDYHCAARSGNSDLHQRSKGARPLSGDAGIGNSAVEIASEAITPNQVSETQEAGSMKTSLTAVQEIVSQRAFAIVGVSRDGKKFGNTIYRELTAKGYKLFVVHPYAQTLEGQPCYPTFRSLPEKVGAVIVCVPPTQSERVVKEAFDAGITRIWLQQGAESYAAIRYCENNGMTVAHGHCILMFAEPVRSFHSFHRWFWKLIGRYPSAPVFHHR